MVTRRLLVAALALVMSACAAVWGFEPLSLGKDDGDGGSDDAEVLEDGAVGAPPSTSNAGKTGNADDASQGPWCGASATSCVCSRGQPGNGQACSAESLGVDPAAVICCADPSYPNNGSCSCDWIGCTTDTTNGTNCQCGPANDKPGGSCAPDDARKCCRLTGAVMCICSVVDCMTGFEPMGNQCMISELGCPGARHQVTSCN